jgi:hypothetical protein
VFQIFITLKDGTEKTVRSTSQVERFFKTTRSLILGKSIAVDSAHHALMTEVYRINVRSVPCN